MDYIKLSRKLMEWEWYKNINTCRLFIHMLLKANWKDSKFEGKVIPRGSFVSSIGNLAKETGLTCDEIRTAIKHLISTNEITKQSYSKFTVFTVNNYSQYQGVPKQLPNQSPSSSHSIPTLFPTIEEINIYGDDVYIISRAKELSESLLMKYWGRVPTDADVEHVSRLITLIENRRAVVSEDKVQLLEYAFECSSNAGALNWNYIQGVWDRLKGRGITNIEHAYEFDVRREFGG